MTTVYEKYYEKFPKSAELFEQAKLEIPAGSQEPAIGWPFPIFVEEAHGALQWDVDGNELIDWGMGYGALILGHCHPAVLRALEQQLAKGTNMATPTPYEIRWAQAIKRLIPSSERVRFTASGATASLLATRVARAYTGRTMIVKFPGHYHSWQGDVAMDAGILPTVTGVPSSHLATVTVIEPDLGSMSDWLSSNGNLTAAVIVDPLGPGVGETDEEKWAFLHTLRELTAQHGVLLILDEAVSGFRLSMGGAQKRYEVEPDLTVMAKIVAGGLPGGAVGGKAMMMDLVGNDGDPRHIAHASTGNGNPLSAVAGAATLELIEREPINAQADATAGNLTRELNTMCQHLQLAGRFQCIASLVEPKLEGADPKAFRAAMAIHGVRGWGFVVSAIHDTAHIDATVEAFEKSVRMLRADGLMR